MQATAAELEVLSNKLWEVEEGRITAMKSFQNALEDLTAKEKIVFIVDELDRCRPDYALNLLEVIKHFFEVPGVHFVLGANLNTIKSSISNRYGARIGEELYLQKFISIHMRLPDGQNAPAPAEYFYAIKEKLKEQDHPISRRRELLQNFASVVRMPHVADRLSLRAVDRALNRVALLPNSIDRAPWCEQLLVSFASLLEVIDRGLFLDFCSGVADRASIMSLCEDYRPHDQEKITRESQILQCMCGSVLGASVYYDILELIRKNYLLDQDELSGHFRFILKESFSVFCAPKTDM